MIKTKGIEMREKSIDFLMCFGVVIQRYMLGIAKIIRIPNKKLIGRIMYKIMLNMFKKSRPKKQFLLFISPLGEEVLKFLWKIDEDLYYKRFIC